MAALLGVMSLPAAVQAVSEFPGKPMRIILPLPPGGTADRLIRLFAERLAERYGQPVIVESRPGGGMVIGTQATVRAAPDGHTLGMIGSSMCINQVRRTDLPYDALQDLVPVARVGYYTIALLATPDFPANDVGELIRLVKDRPGEISCGSNGIGTSTELAIQLLNQMAGIELRHVPYPGGPKLYADMLGNHIQLAFTVMGAAENFVKAGQLKVLGVTGPERAAHLPQAPALAEQLPGYEILNWTGFGVPAGVPTEIVQRLSSDILEISRQPDIRARLEEMGIELSPLGYQEMRRFIEEDVRNIAAIEVGEA